MPLNNEIYYAESRGGKSTQPPVILIHGAGSNHLVWPAEIRRLKGYRVLALDLPGHGKSPGVGQHAIEGYTQAIETFLEKLKIFKAYIVGHSMGGAIGIQMALKTPERVAGLGLISSGAHLAMAPEILTALSNPTTFPEAYKMLENRLFGKNASEKIVKKSLEMLHDVRPGVLYSDWTACQNFDRYDDIKKISVPTWIGVGSEDRLTPVANSRYMADQIIYASIEVFRGAGHMLLLEQPKRTAQSLLNFLKDISKTNKPNKLNNFQSILKRPG